MKLLSKIACVAALLPFLFTGVAVAEGLDEIPKEIQDRLYNKDMLDPQQPISASAYRDWKAKRPPPWTIGSSGLPASPIVLLHVSEARNVRPFENRFSALTISAL